MKKKFIVTGMTCSACSAHVEKTVQKVDGVKKVSVSLLANSMMVDGDFSVENVISALQKAGYGCSLEGQRTGVKSAPNQEQGVTLFRLLLSIGLCLALMYVAMGHMIKAPLPSFLEGAQNATNFALVQLLLCLPVWYINRSYFIVGFKRLFQGSPNMDSLIAVGSTAGALYGVVIMFVVGNALGNGNMEVVQTYHHQLYFESSAMILALVDLGKYLEGKSKRKTGDALSKLKKLAPSQAVILQDGKEKTVDLQTIQVGDVVIVKAGMVLPCDGKVTKGSCFVDQSALTGESLPVEKQLGEVVLGGTTCVGGYVEVQVTTIGEQSTLSKIIAMVEEAGTSKAPIQQLADKIASVFVPVVMTIALVVLVIWLAVGTPLYTALDFAISVLVISCPCALGLATPVALMVATGKGAQKGILIKNGEVLQKLSTIQTVVLDKTGTVTIGKPFVTEIFCQGDQREFLSVIGGMEKQSEHPLGQAIVEYAQNQGITLVKSDNYQTIVGQGITATVNGVSYAIGNNRLMQSLSVNAQSYQEQLQKMSNGASTCLIACKDNAFWGIIAVGDRVKDTSFEAITSLKKLGVKTVLLTGDNTQTAQFVCNEVGIDEYFAEVLPHQKAQKIQQLQQNSVVAMVGDGINDAPALAVADVGFAVASGTDIAIDSADVVLVNNDLNSVATAIKLSQATVKNIKQNLFWAFFYNALCIPLAGGALYPLWGIKLVPMIGALAMSCSSLLVVTNALRLRFFGGKSKKSNSCPIVLEQPKDQNMKYVLSIEGMMCSHCTGRVEQTLKSLANVTEVTVSLQDKSATVTTTCEMADELKNSVENQGYKVLEVTKL